MNTFRRILAVTSGLALAGAVSGALSGVLVIQAIIISLAGTLAPRQSVAASCAIGGIFGAVVAPALAWSLLRRVAVGRAIIGIAAGAGLGGAIGVLVSANFVNPYVPFAINRPPIPQAVIGALMGATLAAAYLRVRSRQGGTLESPG